MGKAVELLPNVSFYGAPVFPSPQLSRLSSVVGATVDSRGFARCPQERPFLQLMMSTKAGFRLAPPTRKPSMSGCVLRSVQFFSDTEPP